METLGPSFVPQSAARDLVAQHRGEYHQQPEGYQDKRPPAGDRVAPCEDRDDPYREDYDPSRYRPGVFARPCIVDAEQDQQSPQATEEVCPPYRP